MSYIEESLAKGEEIKHLFDFNWVTKALIVADYILFGALAILAVSVAVAVRDTPLLSYAALFLLIPLLLVPIIHHLRYLTTEMGCTNQRVILKKGIISRKSEEHLLAKIETVEIRQNVLERILGFGSVKITGTGSSTLAFKNIDDPIGVKKAIEGEIAERNA